MYNKFEVMDSLNLIKEDLSEHPEAKMPYTADYSMKSGEIFRNDKGEYSFMCFHCGFTSQDFNDTVNHIDAHFDDVKWDIKVQAPELVICGEIEPHVAISQMCVSNVEREPIELPISNVLDHTPEMPVLQDRRRKNPVESTPQHSKIVHDFNHKVYQCFICGKYYKSFAILKQHISSQKHSKSRCYHCEMEPPISNPSDARRHKCLFCKEWFPNHNEFKIHFKAVHDKDADSFFNKRSNCNIFTCYVCEKEFPLRYYLVEHMKIHHEKFLRHQCPTCGRVVRSYGKLTQHLKKHEGKIFACDQCDKTFTYYAKLRKHLWTHKTELNYKCSVCPKSFKVRPYLTRHMAVHNNAKQYACRFCDASFNFTSGRRAHEKSQHKAL